MTYLLDTNICIYGLKNKYPSLTQKLFQIHPDEIAVSAVTVSELEYNNVTYNKGLLLFDTLRNAAGDDKFFGILKKYFESNRGKIAGYESLIAGFEGVAGAENIFDSFLEGKILI